MVNSETLLLCDIVLGRYLDLLAEHPEAMTAEFKGRIADAHADVQRARQDEFLQISRAVQAVPTQTDQASLLSLVARGSAPP